MMQNSADDTKVPEPLDMGLKVPEAPRADDNYLDFILPSIDAHAARLHEHPAWPWVTMSMEDGGGAVEVDYMGLTVG